MSDKGWLHQDDCWSAAMGRHKEKEPEPRKPLPKSPWWHGLTEIRPGVWAKDDNG